MQRAGPLIRELGADLDRQLAAEPRSSERLRMLRETTYRITRTANDAIQAYRRARRSADAEIGRAGPKAEVAAKTREQLRAARSDLLAALDAAGRRYPAASPRGIHAAQDEE